MTIARNDPCPCGSGKKYKRCCGASREGGSRGPKAAIRMKGGVSYDPVARAYRAIVHSWVNAECLGVPEEWQTPETFPTEDAAMAYYKLNIRPELERLMAKMSREGKGGHFQYRRLEE
jgi:hypothetical protein